MKDTNIEGLSKRIKRLEEAVFGPDGRTKLKPHQSASNKADLDFEANERNFVRVHGAGLAGRQKFVLLIAYRAKGKLNTGVQLKDVERMWHKMTSLMGGPFNRKYSNDAKEKGWVNTSKQGLYVLRPTWREIFGK